MRHNLLLNPRVGSRRLAALLCLGASSNFAAPAVRIWDGGGFPATNWSIAANWDRDTLPSAGDDIVFPAGAPGNTNFNDLGPGTVFNSITLGGPDYLPLGVNALALTAGIASTNALGNNTVLISVTVAVPLFAVSNAAGGSLSLNGQDATFACGGSMLMFAHITNDSIHFSGERSRSGLPFRAPSRRT